MLIRIGYDIRFDIDVAVPVVALLSVHPSRRQDLREADAVTLDPAIPHDEYIDSFGNICTRFVAPPGTVSLTNSSLISDSGAPDEVDLSAPQVPIGELPPEVLRFLMASRYCEVDLLSPIATDLFGAVAPGWPRVQAVCDWVHQKVTFSYPHARPTRTALDVFAERVGVCRDFQHLAVTLCRCLNIPARYATGYLGDIGVPFSGLGDFSAWFEVYLGGRWWTCDARHNEPRIGRVLMATGRDATDVAMTTSFGAARLSHFTVVTDEVDSGESARRQGFSVGATPASPPR